MDDADAIVEARARAGQAIRDIGHAFIGRHATLEQIERLANALETIGDELWPADPRSRGRHQFTEREPEEYPQGRFEPRFDDRPVSGRSSPWGLDLRLHRHGDEIEARVTLRAAHEGAPGRCHGGIVAALFDDVFGYVLGVIRQSAFTGELTIRYHHPTPLHRELSCRVRRDEQVGRKILMSGTLVDVADERVVASARATFIAVDPEMFARLTAERPAPPDESATGA
jgi:acyl-coenzyme A thioesterase PaaI-like protein